MRYSLFLSLNTLSYWRRYLPFHTSRVLEVLGGGTFGFQPFKNRDLQASWVFSWALGPLYGKSQKKFEFGFDSSLYLIKEENYLRSQSREAFQLSFLPCCDFKKRPSPGNVQGFENMPFIFDLSRGGLGGASTNFIFFLGSKFSGFGVFAFKLTSVLASLAHHNLKLKVFAILRLTYSGLKTQQLGGGVVMKDFFLEDFFQNNFFKQKNHSGKPLTQVDNLVFFSQELITLRAVFLQVCLMR